VALASFVSSLRSNPDLIAVDIEYFERSLPDGLPVTLLFRIRRIVPMDFVLLALRPLASDD